MKRKKKNRKPRKVRGDKPWSLEDFVEAVDETMEMQAKEHPHLRQVHARLSPEWKDVARLVQKLLDTNDPAETGKLTEAVVSRGEIATRILIDLMQTLVHKNDRTT